MGRQQVYLADRQHPCFDGVDFGRTALNGGFVVNEKNASIGLNNENVEKPLTERSRRWIWSPCLKSLFPPATIPMPVWMNVATKPIRCQE